MVSLCSVTIYGPLYEFVRAHIKQKMHARRIARACKA